ncbi:hypothetical protein LEP1GSC034_1746 [Leptospira interrogans str. 2003000735]|uniref:Uncharacterized protein n=1 Tax=Leptospira interrogans str. UI 12621 TaxID=1049937 RepID=A0A0F6H4Q2_LEPIR|nr:hypothetical protein LEP1GSC104_0073 [Leptospira interrogans str. UI 12621]EKO97422.1 hypothetical protein LEP1GSC057_1576 [Leptospira interrogans str. Brem 329]EMJ69634.1 hypothetical protein LEP1GSC033_2010 [Leptospira interrogans str. 2002000632]EMJ70324.1 hypothetical protein LEP1GSC034_1746 [Leptospira interrogans str. 2003000735]EMJ79024.1 hypothetical protein LEP1GSC032_3517 [Leptospira interrogans str. 2002000631]EMN55834.1 hypothetical protein LEP1GSC089_4766 [Leptospira interrogan
MLKVQINQTVSINVSMKQMENRFFNNSDGFKIGKIQIKFIGRYLT